MRTKLAFGTLLMLLMSIASYGQGSVKISIEKVNNENGKIYISMFNKTKDVKKEASIEAKNGNQSIVFSDVPEGEYMVQVVQDVNSNGEIDAVMGIPKEPVGFSQNPSLMFGVPGFDKMAFAVTSSNQSDVSIKLKKLL